MWCYDLPQSTPFCIVAKIRNLHIAKVRVLTYWKWLNCDNSDVQLADFCEMLHDVSLQLAS